VDYIDAHREKFGVAPICRVLTEHGIPIAPSTFYDALRRQGTPSPTQRRDEELCEHIARVHADSFGVYGARKVWLQLNREGVAVARCTVERLMKQLGLQGVRRGKVKRTTITDPAAARPQDLVGRRFGPTAPNLLWVADITYVSTWSGWVYVGFVIDAYARMILGWRTSTSMTTQLVLDAVDHAIWTRGRGGVTDLGGVIHHTDAGSQGGFNWSSQHLTTEVLDGKATWVDSDADRPAGEVVAGPTAGAARCGAEVLGEDRRGTVERGGGDRGWCVRPRWCSLVPRAGGHAVDPAHPAVGPVPIVRRA
jgi:putative transposase